MKAKEEILLVLIILLFAWSFVPDIIQMVYAHMPFGGDLSNIFPAQNYMPAAMFTYLLWRQNDLDNKNKPQR